MGIDPMDDPKTTRRLPVAACYAAVLAFTGFLLFYHLENHLLWGDEAETAVLARNVAHFGLPVTQDGTNYIILHGTIDETRGHVWTWSPWLQEYLAAGSFLLFGPTTWAARAPFAFIGLVSVMGLGWVAWKIFQRHRIALAAMLLLGTSEVFLLHARQCRYYSISVWCEILLLYAVYLLFRGNRRGVWLAGVALVLEYYSNYIIAVANVPALLVLAWMLRKPEQRGVRRVAAILAILAAAALPWMIYARPWRQGVVFGGEDYWLKGLGYLTQIHFYFMPLCFLLLPLLGLMGKRKKTPPRAPEPSRPWERFILILLGLYFVVIVFTPGFFLRYLLPILPAICLVAAVWVFRYIKWPALAAAVIGLQAATNLFPLVTGFAIPGRPPLRFPVVEFVEGMATPYTNRFADVLDFFNREARPGDRVLSFDPEFPLIFYTKLKIVDGRLAGDAPMQWPRWILPLPASGVMSQEPAQPPADLDARYDEITLEVHDSPLGDSYPQPGAYQYHTSEKRAPFVIYKLKQRGQ